MKDRKHIEQEKIQQIAMIPAREAKQLTYRLLHENFLQLQELRKSMANNPGLNKTFFLFHIDLEEVKFTDVGSVTQFYEADTFIFMFYLFYFV